MNQPTFDGFARHHLPILSGYAVALTGDRDTASDIVQDVLIKVYRNWGRFETIDNPPAYLRQMVTNQYLSWRRRFDVRHVVTVAADVLNELSPRQRDAAADNVERTGQRTQLWHEMNSLNRTQRAVLVLRYYEQLSYAEIAVILGCREGTARVACSRGLTKLREQIGRPDADTLDTDRELLVSL